MQDIKRTSKARWHHPNSEEDSEEKDGNADRQEGLANIFKMSRQLIQPKQKKKKGGLERQTSDNLSVAHRATRESYDSDDEKAQQEDS